MWKSELDPDDQRLLALAHAWARRGLLAAEVIPDAREYLHATEFDLAWDLVLAAVSSPDGVTAAEVHEAADLIAQHWHEDFDRTPEQHSRACLEWSPSAGVPFPSTT